MMIRGTGALALALVGIAGCATFDDGSPTPPPAGAFTAEGGWPSVGTRWVLKQSVLSRDTGKTQTQDLTWVLLEEDTHEGRPVVRIWDGQSLHVRDRASGSWIGLFDRSLQSAILHTPHDGAMSSPLWVGKEWTARSTRHERYRNATFYDVTVVWKVLAFEDVTVPAGTFKAFRIDGWPDRRDPIKKRTYWYAPDLKVIVKETTEGYGRPYAVGVGADWTTHTSELVSYSTPGGSIPNLIAAIRDPATRMETLWQLGRIGRPARDALPAVIEVLRTDQNDLHRVAAASTVRALTVTASEVPALVPALGESLIDIRAAIAIAVKPHAPVALALLRQEMRDDDAVKRMLAVKRLAGLGRVAPADVLPHLTAALDDPDTRVRVAVVHALPDVGLTSMPAYRIALRHPDETVRTAAAGTILLVPDAQSDAVPILASALVDTATGVRLLVVQALGSLGALSQALVEPITRLAETDASVEVREAARRALEDITRR